MQENSTSTNSNFFIDPASLTVKPLESALYIVATPIGNLSDITLRALQTLAGADLIACEDTRVTGKLLQRFSIKTRMAAYHDHNAAKQSPMMLDALENGKSIALVSDAGTPLISDPGFRLINEVLEAGHKVIPLPGASSPIVALSAAGLPTDAFMFSGFLPPKTKARQTRLNELANIPATLVFLESPKRIASALADCRDVLGAERDGAIGRELTKLYETFSRGTLGELTEEFAEGETPKGEIVLMIGPPVEQPIDQASIDAQLLELLKTHHIKEATSLLATQVSLPKRDLYQRALVLKEQVNDGS